MWNSLYVKIGKEKNEAVNGVGDFDYRRVAVLDRTSLAKSVFA